MALGGTYKTGTVTISSGTPTIVTGTGTLWASVAEVGDWIFINGQVGIILTVNSNTQLTLETAWITPFPTAQAYVLLKMSWLRFDPALTQSKARDMLAALAAQGKFWFVATPPPDPGLGEDGDWALYTVASPWRVWLKISGSWVEQAGPAATVANDQIIPDHLQADSDAQKGAFWRRLHPVAAARSSNTIITADDHGRFFELSSTFTQTFTAPASLNSTWWVRLRNVGTGVITLGTSTVNGVSNFPLYPGEDIFLTVGVGGVFLAQGLAGRVLISAVTASNQSVVDFAPLSAAITRFRDLEVTFENVAPIADGVNLSMRVSNDNGANYLTTGYGHARQTGQSGGSSGAAGSNNDSAIVLFGGQDSAAGGQAGGSVRVGGYVASIPYATWNAIYLLNSPNEWTTVQGGVRIPSAPANGLRFFYNSGNISSGTFRLHGLV